MSAFSKQHCQAFTSSTAAIKKSDAEQYLTQLNANWRLSEDGKAISRVFHFKNYYETMAFANVVAMVSHQQDHHPEMSISYNRCHVVYSTHSVGGLSSNDFICAIKTDNALDL